MSTKLISFRTVPALLLLAIASPGFAKDGQETKWEMSI